MKKRDKLRQKRDSIWKKMENKNAKRKAEGGICMLIAMIFILGGLHMCSPDLADAKVSSSRSSSRSYSKPAPKRVYKAPVRKRTAVQKKAPVKKSINLSKRNATGAVVAGAVVTGAVVANNKSNQKPKRTLKKGMYERNGKVCKKNKYGREKCKSKAAYYFDDVLDADDWFEDNDDEEQVYNSQSQPVQQNNGFFIFYMLSMCLIALVAIIFITFSLKRK